MKKRNWVFEILLCAAICFIGFGIYMAQAKDNGTFELEDLEGDRSALAAFPLAGHGGDTLTSFQFTIQDGELDTEYFSYGKAELETLMEAELGGFSRTEGYFMGFAPWDEPWVSTVPIAAEDAALTQTESSSAHLLDYAEGIAGMPGLTLSMDAADIFSEINYWRALKRSGSGWSGEYIGVRYDTGLTLRDHPYFYTMDGTETAWIQNNYENTAGVSLQTYIAQVGEDFYAVTAPDARCEGQTYVFRLNFTEDREREDAEKIPEERLKQLATDRSTYGEAIPIIPIPDSGESIVIGLEGIAERDWLLLYRAAGTTFYADLYDTTGRLLGSISTELDAEAKTAADERYEYKSFHIASEAETDIVCWEEGVSAEIKVLGYLEAEQNENRFGGVLSQTGGLLLWIDPAGNMEQIDLEKNGIRSIVRGNRILRIDSESVAEAEDLEEIFGYSTNWANTLTVIERESGKTLYRGRLKTDFWQDDLENLAAYNTAPKAGYLRDQEGVVAYQAEFTREMELYLLGEWRGIR